MRRLLSRPAVAAATAAVAAGTAFVLVLAAVVDAYAASGAAVVVAVAAVWIGQPAVRLLYEHLHGHCANCPRATAVR